MRTTARLSVYDPNKPGLRAERAYMDWHLSLDQRALMSNIDTAEHTPGGEPIAFIEATTRPANWRMPLTMNTAWMCEVPAGKLILPSADEIYEQGDNAAVSVRFDYWPTSFKREFDFANPYPKITRIRLGDWAEDVHRMHGIDDPVRREAFWQMIRKAHLN